MRRLSIAAIGILSALAFAAPATAQNYGWQSHHDQQHDRLDQRHDDVHDNLGEEHAEAHEQGLSTGSTTSYMISFKRSMTMPIIV